MDKALLDEIREELGKLKKENMLVIVEGINDKKALNEFGITNVRGVKGTPIYKLVESIKEKETAILTDLDNEGKKLYHELKDALQRHGIRINDTLRLLLFKTELRQIEGLANYMVRAKLTI
ncbi:MAG: toprim domain-containing protein [Nanoarchaeota archaeon]|nr:toprim domain-containing protein [Nanoarchaeota archaeon]